MLYIWVRLVRLSSVCKYIWKSNTSYIMDVQSQSVPGKHENILYDSRGSKKINKCVYKFNAKTETKLCNMSL